MRWLAFYERSREEGHAVRPARAADVRDGRSRLPPDDLVEDVLSEMANLSESDTGVPGTIFVSTAMGSHGPRVKWYPKVPGRQQPCLIMSIGPEPAVRDDFLPSQISRPMISVVAGWVKLNHEELLRFWHEGETWDRHAVSSFFDGLLRSAAQPSGRSR